MNKIHINVALHHRPWYLLVLITMCSPRTLPRFCRAVLLLLLGRVVPAGYGDSEEWMKRRNKRKSNRNSRRTMIRWIMIPTKRSEGVGWKRIGCRNSSLVVFLFFCSLSRRFLKRKQQTSTRADTLHYNYNGVLGLTSSHPQQKIYPM